MRVWTLGWARAGFGVGLCGLFMLSLQAGSLDGALLFPHFVSGGGVACEIVLMNQAGSATTVRLEFFDPAGQPIEVSSGSELFSQRVDSMPADGVYRLKLSPFGPLLTGYVLVHPDFGVKSLSGSIVFTMSGGQVSVPAVGAVNHWRVPVEEGNGVKTGLAIANPETQPLQLQLKLVGDDGTVRRQRQLTVEPKQRVSKFVSELFEPIGSFTLGSVTASSSSVFSGLSLRQDSSGALSVLGWGEAPSKSGIGTFPTVEVEPSTELIGAGLNIDSLAIWEAPVAEDTLLFVTGKGNRLVEVWKYPFTDQQLPPLAAPFGEGKVNGVAVDQHRDQLFVSQARPSARVYVFDLPQRTLVRKYSNLPLGDEPNLGIFWTASAEHLLLVTDDHYVHSVQMATGAVVSSFLPPLKEIETVAGDSVAGVIYVPDERERQGIFAYRLDGTPFKRCNNEICTNQLGAGVFQKDAEGILIYKCPALGLGDDGRGFLVAVDQRLSGTEFEVFDRTSWEHLGNFKLKGVSNTDGIASSQRPLPAYPLGIFAAVNDDTSTAVVGWDVILAATGLSCE